MLEGWYEPDGNTVYAVVSKIATRGIDNIVPVSRPGKIVNGGSLAIRYVCINQIVHHHVTVGRKTRCESYVASTYPLKRLRIAKDSRSC
jgi:hypothetical protein